MPIVVSYEDPDALGRLAEAAGFAAGAAQGRQFSVAQRNQRYAQQESLAARQAMQMRGHALRYDQMRVQAQQFRDRHDLDTRRQDLTEQRYRDTHDLQERRFEQSEEQFVYTRKRQDRLDERAGQQQEWERDRRETEFETEADLRRDRLDEQARQFDANRQDRRAERQARIAEKLADPSTGDGVKRGSVAPNGVADEDRQDYELVAHGHLLPYDQGAHSMFQQAGHIKKVNETAERLVQMPTPALRDVLAGGKAGPFADFIRSVISDREVAAAEIPATPTPYAPGPMLVGPIDQPPPRPDANTGDNPPDAGLILERTRRYLPADKPGYPATDIAHGYINQALQFPDEIQTLLDNGDVPDEWRPWVEQMLRMVRRPTGLEDLSTDELLSAMPSDPLAPPKPRPIGLHTGPPATPKPIPNLQGNVPAQPKPIPNYSGVSPERRWKNFGNW